MEHPTIRPDHLLLVILQMYQDEQDNQLFIGETKRLLDELDKRTGHRFFPEGVSIWLRKAIDQAESHGTIVRLLDGKILTTPRGALVSDRTKIPPSLYFLIRELVKEF